MKKKSVINLSLFFISIIFLLALLLAHSCKKNRVQNNTIDVLNDTISYLYDKNGAQTASIKALQLESEKAFLKIKTKDSTISWLQDVVKDYQGKLDYALVLANNTTSSGSTVTIVEYDTIYNTEFKYPIYSTMWENKWERGYIRATRDSIYRDIKISNEFEATTGKGKNKLFKKREYAISVKNKNPNTLTTELRSINIRADPKRLTLGLFVGYGYSLKNYELSPQIGIGINYTILPIK
jgi:hypothetical protein